MNIQAFLRRPLFKFLTACVIIPLLLAACQTVNVSTGSQPEQPTTAALPTTAQPPASTQPPAATPVTPATQIPPQATLPPAEGSAEFGMMLTGAAADVLVETIAAVPASAGGPVSEVAPEHRRVTLQGYPVANHSMQPRIYIYPLADLAIFNPDAGQVTALLQALLQSQQPVEQMPFLPLINSAQAMHAQVQYMEFKSGKGVRFLTQFNQGIAPINNTQLIYTFQGITSDGKYYVAAVLPVTHPGLPSTQQVSVELNDFPAYLANTAAWLEKEPKSAFAPDLEVLDAMIRSIEVK